LIDWMQILLPRRLAVTLLLAALGCGQDSPAGPGEATRPFAMGFTDFPHARSLEAISDARAVVARDGALAVLHFDDGVPWDEALAGAPYPHEQELRSKAEAVPSGHVTHLALTPLAFLRDGLAADRGVAGSEPLPSRWQARALGHPEVVAAFAAHCERMIARFDPDYIAYAIEANMLFQAAPQQWPAFVTLAREIYARIKARHPALPVFVTVQADFFHGDPSGQRLAIEQVLPYTDLMAVSTYPFTGNDDVRNLRGDHFTALADLAPGKRFAVAETAWPAEDVGPPYPGQIDGSEEAQRLYVERLLGDGLRLRAAFVTWFFTRDYDDFWEDELRHLPEAPLIRLCKDTGLFDGAGRPRPALASWRSWRDRPRRPAP
jgi:hypothetical protein